VLEVTNAHKTFFAGTPNAVHALRGVDLKIERGSWVCVIGTNGSGKSTLLNAVAGGFRLDEGSISIDGIDVSKWPEHCRAKLIGRVFQDPFSGTAPSMTLFENLALASRRGQSRGLGLALNSVNQKELTKRVAAMELGLENRMDNPIGSFSGGQRQSLTLLMATLIRPQLLLLDEHTAALDPRSSDQIIRLTKRSIEQDSLTTMMVTHSMQQAVSVGDRVIMMDQGRIVLMCLAPESRA